MTPTLQHISLWAGQYVAIEGLIVTAGSLCTAYFGLPPWALRADGSWMRFVARLALWTTLCTGLADLLNGDVISDYPELKPRASFLAVWLLAGVVQLCCLATPAVPDLATIIVAGVAAGTVIAVHAALASPRQWPSKTSAAVLRTHSAVRWGVQALMLFVTADLQPDLGRVQVLLHILASQAVWQFYAWVSSIQSGLSQSFGLYVNALVISQIVAVRVLWLCLPLGVVHAAIAVHCLIALSAVLYEPRVTLPFLTENTCMRIWCGPALASICCTCAPPAAVLPELETNCLFVCLLVCCCCTGRDAFFVRARERGVGAGHGSTTRS